MSLLTLGGNETQAQITDVQALMATEPRLGLQGSAELNASLRQGNNELWVVGAGTVLDHWRPPHRWLLNLSAERGESGGTRNVHQYFSHLRYRRALDDTWALEAFTQAEFDEFRRLAIRALGGGGVRWRIAGRQAAALGLAGMGEYEKLRGEPDGIGGDATLRLSSYLTVGTELAPGWRLSSTTYLQPRVVEPNDLRVSSRATLEVRPGERLAMRLGAAVVHDSNPAEAVEKTDLTLRTGLSAEF